MRLSRPALAVAVGAVLLVSGCDAAVGSTTAAAPSSGRSPGKHSGEQHVRGTVSAENGTTWTITNAKNRPVTVTVTPQTAYGTKKAAATAAQFPVGSQVTVTGTKQGDDAITATRVAAPAKPAPTT